jgi:hypothetical protein
VPVTTSDTQNIEKSRKQEIEIYLSEMDRLYGDAIAHNGEIYEIAERLTKGFTAVTADAIIEDSRILGILRYCIAPSISQMKFGQVFSNCPAAAYESNRVCRGPHYNRLLRDAPEIAAFITAHLDRSRFIWLNGGA